MLDKLEGVEQRFNQLEKLLSEPEIVRDREAYEKYSKEHSELNKIVTVYRAYMQTALEIKDSRELLRDSDPDIKELARTEIRIALKKTRGI
jgi:peptide chain release factor 1